jgi:hypothetical protein
MLFILICALSGVRPELPPACTGNDQKMTARRLTKQIVDALTPRDTDYVEWCGKLRGFGCRVRPSGRKAFICQYRVGGRNAPLRKVTIGGYGKWPDGFFVPA